MDIFDLRNHLAHGASIEETATFLCRDNDEMREKALELRLVHTSR
jgi:hypothetical protein